MKIDISQDKDLISALANDTRKSHASRQTKTRLRWQKQTIEADIRRLKSEFAYARFLGIKPTISSATDGADPGYDGIFSGWTYEVKETAYDTGNLAYNKSLHSFAQDLWCLAIVPVDLFDYKIKLAGWIWRKDMPKKWRTCQFDNNALCIHQADLTNVKHMKNLLPKGALEQKQLTLLCGFPERW